MFDVVDRPEFIDDAVIADFEDCADAYDVLEVMKQCDKKSLEELFIEGCNYSECVLWFVENSRDFRLKFEEELEESVKRCEP